METSASYEARSAPSPYPTFVRSGGIFAILFHYAMLRSCWRSAVSMSITQRSGAGCAYLYRAIDSRGATIDFLLSAFRDADAAKRLFRKALSDRSHPQPRVINTDLAPIYSCAI